MLETVILDHYDMARIALLKVNWNGVENYILSQSGGDQFYSFISNDFSYVSFVRCLVNINDIYSPLFCLMLIYLRYPSGELNSLYVSPYSFCQAQFIIKGVLFLHFTLFLSFCRMIHLEVTRGL